MDYVKGAVAFILDKWIGATIVQINQGDSDAETDCEKPITLENGGAR